MAKKKILLVAHQRSGSNMFRAMLNTHPDIYVAPPLLVYDELAIYKGKFPDLTQDENWLGLVDDAVRMANANPHPLPVQIETDEVQRRTATLPRTLESLQDAIVDILTESQCKRIPGVKFSTQPSRVAQFVEHCSWTHTLLLTRDPRDVILSCLKAAFWKKGAFELADYWSRWHSTVVRELRKKEQEFHHVTYEGLLRDPNQVMAAVWQYLEVTHTDGYREFFKGSEQSEASATSEIWGNLDKPLMTGNTSKFYTEWGLFSLRKAEAILHESMRRFGYEPGKLLRFRRLWRTPRLTTYSQNMTTADTPSNALIREFEARYAKRGQAHHPVAGIRRAPEASA
jgi:hypothetical protein